MIVRIDTQQLRIGMYVCELDRPWRETPFMFQGFEIRTEEELQTLRQYCRSVFIIANDAEGKFVVCTIANPVCQPLPGANDGEAVAGWSPDGKSVFVYRGQVVPARIDRLDVASGARSTWKTVQPNFPAVAGLGKLIVTPNGAMAYSYGRNSSELYVIKGLM